MNLPKKLILVESDIPTARVLRDYLATKRLKPNVLFDASSALRELALGDTDILLADTGHMPDMDAVQFCREVRRISALPLLLFSEKSGSTHRAQALNAGADDFLLKPLELPELSARIHAVWRRYMTQPPQATPEKYIAYPQLSVNLSNYTVLCRGRALDMAPKELELLYFLASSPNQVFSREQLLDQIWGYDYLGDARTVDVHIKRIREKIKDHAAWSLDTVWGVGYRFSVYPSRTSSDGRSAAAAQSDSAAALHTK